MTLDLFQLLPAVYRLRDAQIAAATTLLTAAEQAEIAMLEALATPLTTDQQAQLALLTAKAARGPLESLLMVIAEQVAAIGEDLDQLYDDQFIETCADWVIPYIGDLIGYQSVHGITPQVDNPRAEVAATISLRRRKGTVLVMEQLARDVTGWGAHAVECFKVLADAQYMKHIRPANLHTPDMRRWQTGLYVNTGFDHTAHAVDVHRIATGRGRYNIQNIAVFLWSLGAYSVTNVPATAAPNTPGALACFRFSPLGMDMPLFHRAQSQGEPVEAAATPVNVADRLRRRALCEDIQRGVGSAWYGPGQSLALVMNGKLLNPYQVRVADLSGNDGDWANASAPGVADAQYAALVDPELGRILLPVLPGNPPPAAPQLAVTYYRGFNADMGGGEYAREQNFIVTNPAFVFPYPDTAGTKRYVSLQDALAFVAGRFGEAGALAIEVAAGAPPDAGGPLTLDLPAGTTLELRAADGAAPTLFFDGELSVTGDAGSTLILDGFVVAAASSMTPATSPATSPAALVHVPVARPDGTVNLLGELMLRHCTLVPGWSVGSDGSPQHADTPALIVDAPGTALAARRAIVGPIRAVPLATVNLCDCIVDATDRTRIAYAAPGSASGGGAAPAIGGGALTLQGCTVIGKVHAELLALVSESIVFAALAAGDPWAAGLVADRKQAGCVRFSFLPYGAITPRRFECVEAALASPKPLFLALRYGHPAYAKLAASTDDSIRRGAEDGGEMGAFHFVLAPLREIDLKIRMQEYLPVGLEFGLIYQT